MKNSYWNNRYVETTSSNHDNMGSFACFLHEAIYIYICIYIYIYTYSRNIHNFYLYFLALKRDVMHIVNRMELMALYAF